MCTALRSRPGAAKFSKHMILFQPGGGQMAVNETYILENAGKTTWNDPDTARCSSSCRPARAAKRTCRRPAPGGMPIAAGWSRPRRAGRLRGGFPGEAGRDADRRELLPCPTRRARRTRARSSAGREHLPDRAQRRDAGGRRPEGPGRGAADAGTHLRLDGEGIRDCADGHGGGRAAPIGGADASDTAAGRRSSRSCRGCTRR